MMLHKSNALFCSALIFLYAAWWLHLGQPRDALSLTLLTAGILPLLPLIPGLWQGWRTPTVIAGFITPFYFAHAVMELFANPDVRAWVAVETFFTAVLFAGSIAALKAQPLNSART